MTKLLRIKVKEYTIKREVRRPRLRDLVKFEGGTRSQIETITIVRPMMCHVNTISR